MNNKLHGPFFIAVVVLFASIGFAVFPLVIKDNLVQYSPLPDTVNFLSFDKENNKATFFKLPVISKTDITAYQSKHLKQGAIINQNILFHTNPAFMIWVILICIVLTIAGGAFPVFCVQAGQLYQRFKPGVFAMVCMLAIISGIGLLLFTSNNQLPGYFKPPEVINQFHILLKNGWLLKKIEMTSIALMIPAMIVIYIAAVASDSITLVNPVKDEKKNIVNAENVKASICNGMSDFNYLSQAINGALQLLAVVVVFSVITSGVLGKSINSVMSIKGIDIYPPQICYAYGMFFSLFLCVVYFPAFFYLKFRYTQFKNMVDELEENGEMDSTWLNDVNSKTTFSGNAVDNLKLAFTVLAPILSSLLPEGFNFFK